MLTSGLLARLTHAPVNSYSLTSADFADLSKDIFYVGGFVLNSWTNSLLVVSQPSRLILVCSYGIVETHSNEQKHTSLLRPRLRTEQPSPFCVRLSKGIINSIQIQRWGKTLHILMALAAKPDAQGSRQGEGINGLILQTISQKHEGFYSVMCTLHYS